MVKQYWMVVLCSHQGSSHEGKPHLGFDVAPFTNVKDGRFGVSSLSQEFQIPSFDSQ
jgi:hypothetical protein